MPDRELISSTEIVSARMPVRTFAENVLTSAPSIAPCSSGSPARVAVDRIPFGQVAFGHDDLDHRLPWLQTVTLACDLVGDVATRPQRGERAERQRADQDGGVAVLLDPIEGVHGLYIAKVNC